MPSLETIDDFLRQQELALAGVSRDPGQFANDVFRRLRDSGRTVHPVNPAAAGTQVEGTACYASLRDLPGPVGGVLVMVPAAAAADVVRDAIAAGIPRVWLHQGGGGAGSVSEEALALCRAHDLAVVDGACPLMFLEPTRGVHRWHARLARRRFTA